MIEGNTVSGNYVDDTTRIIVLSEEYNSYDRYR